MESNRDFPPGLTYRRLSTVPILSAALLVGCVTFAPRLRYEPFAIGLASFIVSRALHPVWIYVSKSSSWLGSLFIIVLSTVAQEAIRIITLFSLTRSNERFDSVVSYGIGWTLVSEIYGIVEVYVQLGQYYAVILETSLENDPMNPEAPLLPIDVIHPELKRLLAAKACATLELLYGMPFPSVPLSILCLRRLDALLIQLSLSLLVGRISLDDCAHQRWLFIPLAFVPIVLNVLWQPYLGIRIQVAAYSTLIGGLALLFVALGSWGVLV